MLLFIHTVQSASPCNMATNIVDDEKWTQGDFTIVSEDNVRFKAKSFHVMSAR